MMRILMRRMTDIIRRPALCLTALVSLCVASVFGTRITDFYVPESVAISDPVWMRCVYDLNGETLYQVKWFKDEKPFFIFEPTALNPRRGLSVPGVYLDLLSSNGSHVHLQTTDDSSEGVYTCEVQTFESSDRYSWAHSYLAVSRYPSAAATVAPTVSTSTVPPPPQPPLPPPSAPTAPASAAAPTAYRSPAAILTSRRRSPLLASTTPAILSAYGPAPPPTTSPPMTIDSIYHHQPPSHTSGNLASASAATASAAQPPSQPSQPQPQPQPQPPISSHSAIDVHHHSHSHLNTNRGISATVERITRENFDNYPFAEHNSATGSSATSGLWMILTMAALFSQVLQVTGATY